MAPGFARAEAEPSIRMADGSPREFRVVWRSCGQGHQGPDADNAREQQSAGPPTTKGPQVALEALANPAETGAGNRIRTGDPQLGKLMLYQLSYSREAMARSARDGAARQGEARRSGGRASGGAGADWLARRPGLAQG
jgi:hypothetical protein